MKQILYFLLIALAFTSCSVTIPVKTRLSEQTLMFIENRNIKANYIVTSNIPDGFVSYVFVNKNGSERLDKSSYKYATESAFKNIWNLYFSSKFNPTAPNSIDIEVTLKELKIREQEEKSTGMSLVLGKSKVDIDVFAIIYVSVYYNGKKYENQFEVNASDIIESQQMNSGTFNNTTYQKDPTEQKAKLFEICLNKTVVKFENFLDSIMLADKVAI